MRAVFLQTGGPGRRLLEQPPQTNNQPSSKAKKDWRVLPNNDGVIGACGSSLRGLDGLGAIWPGQGRQRAMMHLLIAAISTENLAHARDNMDHAAWVWG